MGRCERQGLKARQRADLLVDAFELRGAGGVAYVQWLPCMHWWKQRGRHCEVDAHASHCSRHGTAQSNGYAPSEPSPQCLLAAAAAEAAAAALAAVPFAVVAVAVALRGAVAAMEAASTSQSAVHWVCCSAHRSAHCLPTKSWCLALSHFW